MKEFEKLDSHVFVTKLAGFEHSKYIQYNETKTKIENDDIPLVQGKNIRKGKFVESYDWYISKKISDSLNRSKLNKRCILIPYVGSNLGEVGIFEHKYDCHMASNIAKLELIDDYFNLDYLKYYLQSDIGQSYLFQFKQGSAQPNITMEAIRNTKVLNKNKITQKKIAKVFNYIEDKIENNNKINNNLEELAYTMYLHDFANKIPNGCIGDIILENKKSAIKVGEAKNIKGEYPFFTSGDSILEWNDYLVNGRNLFFNTGGNAGVKFYVGKAMYSTDTWCITTEKYSDYLYFYFKLINKDLDRKFFHGSGLKHLQKPLLKQEQIYIPSEDEINKFNSKVQNMFDTISSNTLENKKLTELKDFLLPMLMNGQLNVDDIEI